ncbi:MAG: FecR domain-containing protein [Chitinophagaceae bacterium]
MEPFENYVSQLQKASRTGYLIAGFIHQRLTIEEEEELDGWIELDESNMNLFVELTDARRVEEFLTWYAGVDLEARLAETKKRIGFGRKAKVVRIWRYAAAVVVLLLVGVGIYFRSSSPGRVNRIAENPINDLQPGSPQAVLKLEDGRSVLLANINDTVINEHVGIRDGVVVYVSGDGIPVMHELVIPRKGFYRLVLPDGTHVWLNSESGIRYPSVFSGTERRVTVTGETYFEVAKDMARPFIVTVDQVEITALGTAFNINAYPGEPDLRTTLVEGSIKISGADVKVLKPGQQLRIKGEEWSLIKKSPVGSITGWVRNEFKFKNTPIREVMRMLERWYDAEVRYDTKIDYHFNGSIDRNLPLSRVLELLEKTGHIHFKTEGKIITVKN